MATNASSNDFNAFCDFLGSLQSNGDCDLTPEQSVEQFRAYQEKMRIFQERTRTAAEQSQLGLSKPLDIEAVLERIEQRVADTSQQD